MTVVVGDSYGGGIVAYIDDTGIHGLIAATDDQSTGIVWITGGTTQNTANGNTSTALGTGQANTTAMMAQNGYTGGAAQVCADYTITVDEVTYSDWYLPSKDELNKLYENKTTIGGFADHPYWSSSEADANHAWRQNFTSGGQDYDGKPSNDPRVRAVRAF